MSVDPLEALEADWLNGEISHAEACQIAREMGYDEEGA